MLFAVEPVAIVFLTAFPDKLSFAFFLVVYVVAFVTAPVGPGELAEAMHHVVCPASFVLSLVVPDVMTLTFDVVFLELANEGGSV